MMKDSLRQANPETTKKQEEDEEGKKSATCVITVSQKKKQTKQAKAGKECHQTVALGPRTRQEQKGGKCRGTEG